MRRLDADSVARDDRSSQAGVAWECELCVVRGADRQHLVRRLSELTDFLKRHPDVALADVAFTLAGEEERAVGTERLAFVAESSEQLLRQMARASERLGNESCKDIRDGSGIYYASRPLYPSRRLAYLFPGEGAQYLGMLGDLAPYFSMVRELIKTGDEVAGMTGHGPGSISRYLLVPPDLSPERREALERGLNGWGNTIYTVLTSNWLLVRLLAHLGLRPQALAGHSIGELSALMHAGCFEFRAQLEHLGGLMQALENRHGDRSAQAAVLAVAASRETVSEAIRQTAAGQDGPTEIHLAIDNCPHQTVAVGWPEAVGALEEQFKARGLIYERLVIDRPYHCPLFEPFTGPVRDLFRSLPFEAPKLPVYCCTTASQFPPDPAEIRKLCVRNWVSTVEFARMVRQMHEDGVGLFLEAGPKGNLTAFVDDVLLGRDYLAVAANLGRRSGLRQLLHMAGQLTAHHVPVALDRLFAERSLQEIAWNGRARVGRDNGGGAPGEAERLGADQDTLHGNSRPTSLGLGPLVAKPAESAAASGREAVLHAHWRLMDKFLDTSRFVTGELLQGRSNGRARANGEAAVHPEGAPGSLAPATAPLIDDIVAHEPRCSLVAVHRLDPRRDLYGAHHALGGYRISKLDPSRHGMAIMPLTFVIELLAEAAAKLVPGRVVTEVNRLRMLRWLPIEDPPAAIEVSAEVVEPAQGAGETRVRTSLAIRTPGSPAAPGEALEAVADAEIVLAEGYPEPPAVGDRMEGERPCRVTVEEIYRNLFHGPLFQGMRSLDRTGRDAIEGEIEVLPRKGLLASDADPAFAIDPVTLDVGMHVLVGWHLEQGDASGRVMLPFELERLSLFGPPPRVGDRLTSRGHVASSSPRVFEHAVDIVGPQEQLWCRLSGLKCWRFYLPFRDVNFHGPKDVYDLCDGAAPPGLNPAARPAWHCWLLVPDDLLQPTMKQVVARVWLTASEQRAGASRQGADARYNDWLFGRVAAKDAVRGAWRCATGEALCPADIEIAATENGAPVARESGRGDERDFPKVSLAHAGGMVAALAAFEPHAGIDVEPIEARGNGFEETAFNEGELALLAGIQNDRNEAVTRMWCAKEAVAKALGLGFSEGPRGLSVIGFDDAFDEIYVSLGSAMAAAAPDLGRRPLVVHARRNGRFIIAHTFCRQLDS